MESIKDFEAIFVYFINNPEITFKKIDEVCENDQNIMKFFNEQKEILWTSEEIPFNENDLENFRKLDNNTKKIVKFISLFFTFADDLVIPGLNTLSSVVPYLASTHFYNIQSYIETIHSITYKKMSIMYYDNLEKYKNDYYKMKKAIEEEDYTPSINDDDIYYAVYEKTQLIKKLGIVEHCVLKLIGFFCVECLSFNAIFALINSFRSKISGLTYFINANEFISRDENIHARFGIFLYKNYLLNKPSDDIVRKIIKIVADIEINFISRLFKGFTENTNRLNNITLEDFVNYIKILANNIAETLEINKIYDDLKPALDEFLIPTLKTKSNFFERPSLYHIDDSIITTDTVLNLLK